MLKNIFLNPYGYGLNMIIISILQKRKCRLQLGHFTISPWLSQDFKPVYLTRCPRLCLPSREQTFISKASKCVLDLQFFNFCPKPSFYRQRCEQRLYLSVEDVVGALPRSPSQGQWHPVFSPWRGWLLMAEVSLVSRDVPGGGEPS